MLDVLRHGAAIVLMCGALLFEVFAVLGQYRLHYSLNRIHAAGIGDTMGVLLMVLAAVVEFGLTMISLKVVLVLVFVWVTSPLCGHLIAQMVELTDERVKTEVEEWKS